MTGILTKRENLETDKHTERMLCDYEGRDQSVASTHQRLPTNHQKLGTGIKQILSQNPENEPTLLTP